jgi:WhiB family transcriptional regulator, redox-sensing transcriptional regulator
MRRDRRSGTDRSRLAMAMYDSNIWRDRAACGGTDAELFFPVSEIGPSAQQQILAARQICDACPVQWTCLVWSLFNGVTDGIWGGATESERRRLLPRNNQGHTGLMAHQKVRLTHPAGGGDQRTGGSTVVVLQELASAAGRP